MTTNPVPQQRTPRVLLAAAIWVLASTVVVVVTAAATQGADAAASALLGGGIVLVFFAFGAVFVGLAAQLAPQTALLIAMLTYTLQVAVVAMIFVGLSRSGALDDGLEAGWLAGALIAGTFAWITGQLISTLRTPIEPWTGPTAEWPDDWSDDGFGQPPHGQVSGQEVGAS